MSEVMQPSPSATIPDSACRAEGRHPFEGTPHLKGHFWGRLARKPCPVSLAFSPLTWSAAACSYISERFSLPCWAAWWSSLTPEQKFHARLMVVSDPSMILSQKKSREGIAQVGKIAKELDILTFEKWHFDLFHKWVGFLWVTWSLLLENWF